MCVCFPESSTLIQKVDQAAVSSAAPSADAPLGVFRTRFGVWLGPGLGSVGTLLGVSRTLLWVV